MFHFRRCATQLLLRMVHLPLASAWLVKGLDGSSIGSFSSKKRTDNLSRHNVQDAMLSIASIASCMTDGVPPSMTISAWLPTRALSACSTRMRRKWKHLGERRGWQRP